MNYDGCLLLGCLLGIIVLEPALMQLAAGWRRSDPRHRGFTRRSLHSSKLKTRIYIFFIIYSFLYWVSCDVSELWKWRYHIVYFLCYLFYCTHKGTILDLRDLIVEPASKWVAKQLRIRFGAVQQHVSRESAKVGWPEVKRHRISCGFAPKFLIWV